MILIRILVHGNEQKLSIVILGRLKFFSSAGLNYKSYSVAF